MTEHTEGNAAHRIFLIAEDQAGIIIGLASGGRADAEPSRSIAEIGSLYLLPDRRGQGVGGWLLRRSASELADSSVLALQVAALSANLPARDFCRAMGVREIGKRMFDEEGELLPETIYAWPDINRLIDDSRPGL